MGIHHGYWKKDGEVGYRYIKSIPSKYWDDDFDLLKHEKMEENQMELTIFLDRIQIINDDNEIEFDTGEYHKQYFYQSKKEDKYPYFYRKMLRSLSIHTVCLGDVFPFVFIGEWKKESIRIPIDRSLNSIYTNPNLAKRKWNILLNDVDILNKIIRQNSVLESAIIWYTFGKMSKTHLESFMSYYRCIETFANNFLIKKRRKFDEFINSELHMFKNISSNTLISYLRKDVVSSFLVCNGVDKSTVKRIKEFRNTITHGQEIELEFNINLINTEEEISRIAYNLICKEIQMRKIKTIIHPDFQRDYHLYINEDTKKFNLFESDNINYDNLKPPYTIKQLGAWDKEEIKKVLSSDNVDEKTKKDIQYYLKMVKEGKYRDSGAVFRKMK